LKHFLNGTEKSKKKLKNQETDIYGKIEKLKKETK